MTTRNELCLYFQGNPGQPIPRGLVKEVALHIDRALTIAAFPEKSGVTGFHFGGTVFRGSVYLDLVSINSGSLYGNFRLRVFCPRLPRRKRRELALQLIKAIGIFLVAWAATKTLDKAYDAWDVPDVGASASEIREILESMQRNAEFQIALEHAFAAISRTPSVTGFGVAEGFGIKPDVIFNKWQIDRIARDQLARDELERERHASYQTEKEKKHEPGRNVIVRR